MSFQPEKPEPTVDPDSIPYWEALKERRLILKSCRSCGQAHFYPRELCPNCHSDDLEWIEASGCGEIYSYTICHRAAGPAFAADTPYTIALVTLNEGPRMMTRIVGSETPTSIGQKVMIGFEQRGEDYVLPFFQPAR